MDAFSAGKLDAVMVTNGDALVMGGNGAKSVMMMLTDYSNGNDIIVGKPDIKSIADLKGKKVGLEVGLVEHLLLINGLAEGRHERERRDAGQCQDQRDPAGAGLRATSRPSAPGSRSPARRCAARPARTRSTPPPTSPASSTTSSPCPPRAWRRTGPTGSSSTKVWDKVVAYIEDPKTQPDAVKIMAARVGVEPATYLRLLKGTKLLDLAAGKTTMEDAEGFASLYGSSRNADAFNVKNTIYKEKQAVETYIDPNITSGQ